MQLAIDTSTEIASIALSDKGELLSELTWRCGRNHTAELLPAITQLLSDRKIALGSLQGIIVAKGPGSFNGLRAGMSIAKGLAFALGIPLVGLGTLEIEAFPYAFTELPICPIHVAGKGEIAVAMYQRKGGEWRQISAPSLTTMPALCSEIETKTLFCGELSPALRAQVQEVLGNLAIIPDPISLLRRAGYLAHLGWERFQRGDLDNPITLQPLYLRKPAITPPKSKSWFKNENSSNI